ncbi:unnamed protein product, partial [marine sediment metagenome]
TRGTATLGYIRNSVFLLGATRGTATLGYIRNSVK